MHVGDAQVFTPRRPTVVILASCWACGARRRHRPHVPLDLDQQRRELQRPGGDRQEPRGQRTGRLGSTPAASRSRPRASSFRRRTPVRSHSRHPDRRRLPPAGSSRTRRQSSITRPWTARSTRPATSTPSSTRTGPDATPTAAELNIVANWQTERLLSGAEGDNDETTLSSGPSGIFLTYKWFVANDNRVGLRKFDPVSNTFGGPVYVEGPDPIDNNSLDIPVSTPRTALGRIHVVWRTLHDAGRLALYALG